MSSQGKRKDEAEYKDDDEEEAESLPEGEFEIEVLLKAQLFKTNLPKGSAPDAGWKYLVRWYGFPASHDTWEWSSNLDKCWELRKRFWSNFEGDKNKNKRGDIVDAPKYWVSQERENILAAKKKAEKKAAEHQRRRRIQNSATTSRNGSVVSRSASVATRTASGQPGPPKKRKRVAEPESDSEDDTPLAAPPPAASRSASVGSTAPAVSAGKRPRIDTARVASVSDSEDDIPLSALPLNSKAASMTPSSTSVHQDGPPSRPGSRASFHGPPQSPMRSETMSSTPTSTKPPKPIPLPQRKPLPQKAASRPDKTSSTSVLGVKSTSKPSGHKHTPGNMTPCSVSSSSTGPSTKPSVNTTNPTFSGLSTKARLSQNATVPTAAKSALLGLRFTKKPGTGSSLTPKTTPIPPPPPKPRRDPFFSDQGAPPELMDVFYGPPLISRTSEPRQAAESFLDDLGASWELGKAKLPPKPRPCSTNLVVPMEVDSQMEDSWHWNGSLQTSTNGQRGSIGNISVAGQADESIVIKAALSRNKLLHLETFHELVDMHQFLQPLQGLSHWKAMQIGRISPSHSRDAEALRVLSTFMGLKKLVSLVPVSDDSAHPAAHLLVFTPKMKTLCTLLETPTTQEYTQSPLLIAFIPWTAVPDYRTPMGHLPLDNFSRNISSKNIWAPQLLNHQYQLALRRPYALWTRAGERVNAADAETRQLLAFLAHAGAKPNPTKPRVVFVHVAALKDIRKMPNLIARRNNSISTKFYSYGTDASVPRRQWGLQQIYPSAGIVTFTPSALYEDPWGIVDLILLLHAHPLWMCYMLPSVLGMAIRMCYPEESEEDPLADAFNNQRFVFERLMKALNDGAISLIRAPPLGSLHVPAVTDWIRQHHVEHPASPSDTVKYALGAFDAKYADLPRAKWVAAIEDEVAADLDCMQQQPFIRENYRRFVVIRGEKDAPLARESNGFDWIGASAFKTRDDYTM
ncbi:Chromo domain-containing protein [Mycena kentingensis (nom. inval.)]|nr:Chromo domain-containing protein [Mycena kentingensis (nom. inval.)]